MVTIYGNFLFLVSFSYELRMFSFSIGRFILELKAYLKNIIAQALVLEKFLWFIGGKFCRKIFRLTVGGLRVLG